MISLLFLTLFTSNILAEDLVIIKAVSKTGRSFAIAKGSVEGIGIGQTSLFSSAEASFKAKAISVDKNYSLWQVTDEKASVPFDKNEFVHFSNSLENIWTQLPRAAFIPKSQLGFKAHNIWIARASYTYAIAESISDTNSDQYDVRSGLQFEALFGRRFDIDWEIAGGFRYDRETSTLQNPNLQIPTTRMMAVLEGTYHFYRIPASENSLYLSVGMAYGVSNTTIDDITITGTALVIPVLKLGLIYQNESRYTWVFEGSFESVSSEESFTDQTNVTTNVTNTKFGVGLRF